MVFEVGGCVGDHIFIVFEKVRGDGGRASMSYFCQFGLRETSPQNIQVCATKSKTDVDLYPANMFLNPVMLLPIYLSFAQSRRLVLDLRAVRMTDGRGLSLPTEFLADMPSVPPSLEYVQWEIGGEKLLYHLKRYKGKTVAVECEPLRAASHAHFKSWTDESALD